MLTTNLYTDIIIGFDFIAFLLYFFALIFFLRASKPKLSNTIKYAIICVVVLNLLHSFSNILEWTGVTDTLDLIEEYVETFMATMWFIIFYVFFRDTTEQELTSLKNNLELEVENKSQDLIKLNKNLEEKKRLANIGALAATVAHELRTPLGVIRAAVYNMTKKVKDHGLQKHLVNIDKKITESDRIIGNLLNYSKIRVPTQKPVNCCGLIDECLEDYKAKHNSGNMKIHKHCDCKKELMIEVDELQVRQLFANLLDNACQAYSGEPGDIFLDIKCQKDENRLSIKIRDEGCGMPKEDQNAVFEPFFTTRAHGTGLGLALCKQIVNLHGGFINITSEEGIGTTVLIGLPLKTV